MKFFRKIFTGEKSFGFEEKLQRFYGETLFAKRSQAAREEFSGIPEGRFPFSEDSKGTLFREKGFDKGGRESAFVMTRSVLPVEFLFL